jgi:hypothetical protein
VWLNPEEPEPLIAAMSKWIEDINTRRGVRTQHAEAVNVEAAAEDARVKAARDKMHAKQAAELQASRERQLALEDKRT